MPDISPDKLNFYASEKDGVQSNACVRVCHTSLADYNMHSSVVAVIITTMITSDNGDNGVVPNVGYRLGAHRVHSEIKKHQRGTKVRTHGFSSQHRSSP
jgi:hypothetical protein